MKGPKKEKKWLREEMAGNLMSLPHRVPTVGSQEARPEEYGGKWVTERLRCHTEEV